MASVRGDRKGHKGRSAIFGTMENQVDIIVWCRFMSTNRFELLDFELFAKTILVANATLFGPSIQEVRLIADDLGMQAQR